MGKLDVKALQSLIENSELLDQKREMLQSLELVQKSLPFHWDFAQSIKERGLEPPFDYHLDAKAKSDLLYHLEALRIFLDGIQELPTTGSMESL